MTPTETVAALRTPSAERPLVVLLSACLSGRACGYDGSSYGTWSPHARLAALATARVVTFCPEDSAFGTPRALCDLHGGDGFDALDGRARVLTTAGDDWTAPLIAAAHQMLALAQERRVELAVLMDMSAACGSQVISDGDRTVADRRYQRGAGVCAALLMRHGVAVISQRDYRAWEALLHKLDPTHAVDVAARDHHETDWYRGYFRLKTV